MVIASTFLVSGRPPVDRHRWYERLLLPAARRMKSSRCVVNSTCWPASKSTYALRQPALVPKQFVVGRDTIGP
jgi:hypothetical protein